MSKDAVIRFRASRTLKERVQRLASKREQDLSDFLRLKTIELVEAEERALGLPPVESVAALIAAEDDRRGYALPPKPRESGDSPRVKGARGRVRGRGRP